MRLYEGFHKDGINAPLPPIAVATNKAHVNSLGLGLANATDATPTTLHPNSRFTLIDGQHRVEAFLMYKYSKLINPSYAYDCPLSATQRLQLFGAKNADRSNVALYWPAVVYPEG